jgi:hypothetical protein
MVQLLQLLVDGAVVVHLHVVLQTVYQQQQQQQYVLQHR